MKIIYCPACYLHQMGRESVVTGYGVTIALYKLTWAAALKTSHVQADHVHTGCPSHT